MTRNYRTIKVPKPVFDQIKLALGKIMTNARALTKIENILKPNKCPNCGSLLKFFEFGVKYRYAYCPNCGYKQPTLEISASGSNIFELVKGLGMGVLIGLAIAALLYLLFSSEKESKR